MVFLFGSIAVCEKPAKTKDKLRVRVLYTRIECFAPIVSRDWQTEIIRANVFHHVPRMIINTKLSITQEIQIHCVCVFLIISSRVFLSFHNINTHSTLIRLIHFKQSIIWSPPPLWTDGIKIGKNEKCKTKKSESSI